ncbi:hypothetical protein B0H21DRAFT_765855 [Amylocystis lapponica]|nr:hypothetical protein B0H21DRAFT_765855 [Amylocystis lapponica]
MFQAATGHLRHMTTRTSYIRSVWVLPSSPLPASYHSSAHTNITPAMSTVVFPWPRPDKTRANYTLTRVDDLTAQDSLVIRDPVLMQNNRTIFIQEIHKAVFRATLHRGNKRVADVVCKFTYGKRTLERLRHEAAIYRDQLKDLQGKIVPKLYGLYEGEMDDEELSGCLITQYCGKHPNSMPFCGTSWQSKSSVLLALLKIHKAGVQHGDFFEDNVVYTPKGHPRIVDFGGAEAHTCDWTMQSVFHSQDPHPTDFPACKELDNNWNELAVWTPRDIMYLHIVRPVEYAESAEKLASLAPETMNPNEALSLAECAIDEFYKLWNARNRERYIYLGRGP